MLLLSNSFFYDTIEKIESKIDTIKASSMCFVCEDNFILHNFIDELLNSVSAFNQLDTLIIKPSGGNIKIEQVREAEEFLMYKPNYAKVKVVFFEDIERLNIEAANAALKLIEEPPQYALVFGTTTRWNYLLPTLKSRFIRYDLSIPSTLIENVNSKYEEIAIYLNFFRHYDLGVSLFLNDENTDVSSIKEIVERIVSFSAKNVDELLNNFKLPLDLSENKLKFALSYYKLWDILINSNDKEFFYLIKNMAQIKNDVENLSFLRNISALGAILLRDSMVFLNSSKWKYFWNNSLVYFFGLNEHAVNLEQIKDTVSYLNRMSTMRLANFNFEMEIFTHFLRIKRCFK
ncbi:MAG: DNA polymerase III gamma/tau subunits-like protein [Petrotoga mobilis]|nr:MAG: DNA polymerase III gamma/tau subunits-like protein [Petrotoga mobilis]